MTFSSAKIASLAILMSLASCATPQEGASGYVIATYDAELIGTEVAGAGDADGYAVAQLVIQRDVDAICYNIWNVQGVEDPTSAHIHRGKAGENGPVIATLERNRERGWNGCIKNSNLVDELTRIAPEELYVQIHTTQFPAGAIRGQLNVD